MTIISSSTAAVANPNKSHSKGNASTLESPLLLQEIKVLCNYCYLPIQQAKWIPLTSYFGNVYPRYHWAYVNPDLVYVIKSIKEGD